VLVLLTEVIVRSASWLGSELSSRTPIPIGITISLSRVCTSEVLKNIWAAATIRLAGRCINVRKNNRVNSYNISAANACDITSKFFRPMLGGLWDASA